MDAQRFDRITKSFAARASRRRLVRALAALGLGSGVLGPNHAGARQAPGGSDGRGVTVERTDPTCKGQLAFNNKVCEASPCGDPACFCARSVSRRKKCVITAFACPTVDECNRNRHCGPGQVCIKIGGCCGSRKNVCADSCV